MVGWHVLGRPNSVRRSVHTWRQMTVFLSLSQSKWMGMETIYLRHCCRRCSVNESTYYHVIQLWWQKNAVVCRHLWTDLEAFNFYGKLTRYTFFLKKVQWDPRRLLNSECVVEYRGFYSVPKKQPSLNYWTFLSLFSHLHWNIFKLTQQLYPNCNTMHT